MGYICTAIALVVISSAANPLQAADPFAGAIEPLWARFAQQLEGGDAGKKRLAIDAVEHREGGTNAMADYLTTRLKETAPLEAFEIVEGDSAEIRTALERLASTLSPENDAANERSMGKWMGVQATLKGNFMVTEDRKDLLLFLEMTDLISGRERSGYMSIKMKDLPKLDWKPGKQYQAPVQVVTDATIGAGNSFGLQVWTARGQNGLYRYGERLRINVWSEKDCFIRIYHKDNQGKFSFFYPDDGSQVRLYAQKTYSFPQPPNRPWQVGAPVGTDVLKVVASVEGFTGEKGETLRGTYTKGDVERMLARGLNKVNQSAIATYVFRTKEK